MTDLDPRIWENKTLGSAVNTVSLDQLEAQEQENRDAKAEGREPRTVVAGNRFPGYLDGVTASNVSNVTYVDPPKASKK